MSPPASSWPALAGGAAADLFAYERGVWGKAHGAASDFRWLASSSDFEPGDLARRLALGPEDRPERAAFWLSLGQRCYAGAFYPSRAMDAAGRQDSVEKQVLEWPRPPVVPAALGAFALLPLAARLDDGIWWQRRGDSAWQQPEFRVPIGMIDLMHATLSAEDLARAIARGVAALAAAATEATLGSLYAQLLAGCKPAFLRGLPEPLAAEALAVLLLPLPRARADLLSLAGWLPSSRAAAGELAAWDVVGLPASLTVAGPPVAGGDLERQAAMLARALLAGDPSLLAGAGPAAPETPRRAPDGDTAAAGSSRPAAAPPAGEPAAATRLRPLLRLSLTPPPPGAPAAIHELHRFAVAANRRWLEPQALPAAAPLAAGDPSAAVLLGWIDELTHQRGDADEQQWEVKIDLLRSAALLLAPAAAHDRRALRPSSARVPPLLFAAARGAAGYRLLQALAPDELRRALAASLGCKLASLRNQVRAWLEAACQDPWLRPIAPLLRDALGPPPPRSVHRPGQPARPG